ncbi:MAG: thioredoxin-disulfide reductase [Planctomycetota bacterium]
MSYDYDVIIIGGGPAGMGTALYTGRALMDTLLLEEKGYGGQLLEAYDVDNYLGFPDGLTGAELADKMREHAARFDTEMKMEAVENVECEGPLKRVVTGSDEYTAPIVVIASGASHRKLGVPGEEKLAGAGVSYCATCDGAFYRDKHVIMVGAGDAATTEAVFLTRFASRVTLVHRRQGFRARAVNKQAAEENEKIEFVLDTVITEIIGEDKVEAVRTKNVKTGEESRLSCDGVFVSIGHEPNTCYLQDALSQYAGELVPTDMNMETDVKGLYAVGDVRCGSYRQVSTGVADGVVAAMHAETRIKSLLEDKRENAHA